MWSPVIIIFDPQADSFPRRFEALELGAGEELLPDRFPEALDFTQGHRVMRAGFEVVSAVLFHLGLETGSAAPIDVLTAIVGKHLLGRLILPRRNPEDLQDVFSGVTAKQIRSYDEP